MTLKVKWFDFSKNVKNMNVQARKNSVRQNYLNWQTPFCRYSRNVQTLKELGESVAPNQLALALFMQYGAQQAPRWLEQGLPEMVCYDTLRDIAI